jgi:hypothetical protein
MRNESVSAMRRRARKTELRLIIRPDNVRAGMVMHRAVAIMSRAILRRIGMFHRQLVASIWVRGMLKLIGAHARRTHRGAHGGIGHSDREDRGHDPDAGCSRLSHFETSRLYAGYDARRPAIWPDSSE